MFQSPTFDHLLDATFKHRKIGTAATSTSRHLDISQNESSGEERPHDAGFDAEQTASHCIETPDGKFWVQGDNVLCCCPDCSAPMAVRVWLGLADCWQCRCSLELTQEQLAAVQQLVSEPTRRPLPTTAPMAAESTPELAAFPIPTPPRPTSHSTEQELERLTGGSSAARVLRRAFTMTPAWLMSFLVHLILILILALIVFNQTDIMPSIVLSTFVTPEHTEGGEIRIVDPMDELMDDLQEANDLEQSEEELRDVAEKAEADAKELLKDVAPRENINELKKNITTRKGSLSSFAARDPRVRSEIVKKTGGTTLTEAAVARGLRWLASVQNNDGSWSLKSYGKNSRGDAAGTSLALLPFLGAGQTHESGIYRENVAKGLAWLIDHQLDNGDLREGLRPNTRKNRNELVKGLESNYGMYAHGQATIVLSEALALTGDQTLAEPTQLAIDFIQESQYEGGGWRYKPHNASSNRKEVGDTSVFGWQLMALHSARAPNMGIEVDDDVMKLADYYLDRASANEEWLEDSDYPAREGSLYQYMPGDDDPTKTMTAEAILCRMYLGWERDDPRIMTAVKWLQEEHPPDEGRPNMYYWYYGTQVFHHYGGKRWEKWNATMRELLLRSQEKKGRNAGSWNSRDFRYGGVSRIYLTSLAVCTLEVYYRHLPLFAPIEFE